MDGGASQEERLIRRGQTDEASFLSLGGDSVAVLIRMGFDLMLNTAS